jgi:hypothetical protein
MSALELNKLVGQAVVSKTFRAGILNGQRPELVRHFSLTPEEVAAVLSIEAATLPDFAAAVGRIVANQPTRFAKSHSVPSHPLADDP